MTFISEDDNEGLKSPKNLPFPDSVSDAEVAQNSAEVHTTPVSSTGAGTVRKTLLFCTPFPSLGYSQYRRGHRRLGASRISEIGAVFVLRGQRMGFLAGRKV